MDFLNVAARVSTRYASTAGKCAMCGEDLSSDDNADAVCNKCVRIGPQQPATVIATRKKSQVKKNKTSVRAKDILKAETEYSLNVELSITADFEGTSSKSKLLKKFKSELFAAVKEAVATTAKELELQSTGVIMKPIEIAVAVTDMSDDED